MVTAVALSLFFLADSVSGGDGRVVTMALPRALAAGETAFIEMKIGVIERGAEIELATTSGRLLGVVSPFGIRSGEGGGTYTVPLPADAMSDRQVSVRITLTGYGHTRRAPTKREVTNIRVRMVRRSPSRQAGASR